MTRLPGDRAARATPDELREAAEEANRAALPALAEARRYADARGVPDWDAAETYDFGDVVRAPDGRFYQAFMRPVAGGVPSTSYADWRLLTAA